MTDSPIKRSDTHYHVSRNVVLRVEDTLFSVSFAVIVDRSQKIRESMERHAGDGTGDTDEKPLVLLSVLAGDFESFLDYLLPKLQMKDFSADELESILKVSVLYEAPTGRDFAIEELSKRRDLSAERWLRMSRQYRVPKWFRGSYKHLASFPSIQLSLPQMEAIGPQLMAQMLALRHDIELARRECLYLLPHYAEESQPQLNCSAFRRGFCGEQFQRVLDESVPQIIDTTVYPRSAEVLNALNTSLAGARFCDSCLAVYTNAAQLALPSDDVAYERGMQEAYSICGFD